MLQAIFFLLFIFPIDTFAKTCVYIASYAPGYSYQDKIEGGMDSKIKDHCTVHKFYMDAKLKNDAEYVKQKSLEAKALIESKKPDVVLISNDIAIQAVLADHYKNSSVPFVFFGLPWMLDKIGLPFQNTTGVINVSSAHEAIKEISKGSKDIKTMTYLLGDTSTSKVNAKKLPKIFSTYGVELRPQLVKTVDEWKKGFLQGQETTDALYLGNNTGIKNWDKEAMKVFVQKNMKKLIIGSGEWMTPYSVITFVTVSTEYGELAGEAAIKILNGKKPADIPVATAKRHEIFVNRELLGKVPFKINESFLRLAKDAKESKSQ